MEKGQNRPLKVLMIAPTPFFADRGCHMRILGEIRALQNLGYDIVLCTYHIGRDIPGIKTERIINIPWYKKLEAGSSWHKFYLDVLLFFKSLRVFWREKPDLVHGHLHEGAILGHFVRKFSFRKVPLVFDAQGSLTKELITYSFFREGSLFQKIFWALERWISRMPEYTVGSNVSVSEFMVGEMGLPPARVETVIDGVHSDFFLPQGEPDDLRKTLHLEPNTPVVIYTGALLKSKGIDYLWQAIPQVVKKDPEVRFVIVGYPVEESMETVRSLGVDQQCIFVGQVDYFKLPQYLYLANLAVDPKLDEAGEASGKIINYMGAALPIVCFDGVNNRKFLGESGIFAKSGDSVDLAEKIVETLADPEKAQKIGSSNQRRVEEVFSWNANIKTYDRVFHQALQEAGPS
jgi:glycosyltransferase involved in cell wall biosynthesis